MASSEPDDPDVVRRGFEARARRWREVNIPERADQPVEDNEQRVDSFAFACEAGAKLGEIGPDTDDDGVVGRHQCLTFCGVAA